MAMRSRLLYCVLSVGAHSTKTESVDVPVFNVCQPSFFPEQSSRVSSITWHLLIQHYKCAEITHLAQNANHRITHRAGNVLSLPEAAAFIHRRRRRRLRETRTHVHRRVPGLGRRRITCIPSANRAPVGRAEYTSGARGGACPRRYNIRER